MRITNTLSSREDRALPVRAMPAEPFVSNQTSPAYTLSRREARRSSVMSEPRGNLSFLQCVGVLIGQ